MAGHSREGARVSAMSRWRHPDDPDLADARRDLAAIRLEEHVRRVVDAAPPLSQAQRDRIAAALSPSTAVATE